MINLTKKIKIGQRVFLAPNATAIGKATLGDDVSVWFGAVIRADNDKITIGNRTNIQDNTVLHVDEGFPVIIGHDCIVGHLAIVHGATLGNYVMVGMHSTIMNGAGANSLITAGAKIPPYSLVMGAPAKVIKQLNEEQIEAIKQNAERYVKLKDEYLLSLL